MNASLYKAVSAVACLSVVCLSAAGQSWEYVPYDGQTALFPGYITLEEKDGAATFQMYSKVLDWCVQRPLKATVERDEQYVRITPTPRAPNCPELKFVVKLDGTGGHLEIKQAGAWTVDNRDRKLTLRK